ncbi:galactonate dehydratase [Litorilinea aerophila]|nr:galactonate dehydratase [Litorilinea aerophila]MCC9077221.1 galactonate dehydratase [Litorilinea aerophila]
MKIADLQILRMAASHAAATNWTFVKIYTDTGLYGIGEASAQYKDEALMAELQAFKRFLIGKDPFQIEHIWTSLHRRVTWTGGPVTMSAISAIDLALWDIKGKALGVPVYELLGGKVRETVPLYANGWFAGADSPEEYARQAAKTVAQGYRCVKLYPFRGAQVITPERLELGVARVAAVREAVGPHCEIGVDIRGRLNIWSARRVAQKLEPYDIAWLEEPILFDNVDAMAALAHSVRVPVATGEQLYTRWEFRSLLEKNAVGIIQPDICHAGGMSELKKIATAAETYYVTVAPHNSNGPISTVASLHLDINIPNGFMQELFINHLDRYNEVLDRPLQIVDGACIVPDGPGWGVDLREEVIRRYPPLDFTPVESEPYRDFF